MAGVFKALVNNNIKIDIIAGTSIGGVNAAIIAGAKDGSSPEQFWLELEFCRLKMSKVITRYLRYIEELRQTIEKHVDTTK